MNKFIRFLLVFCLMLSSLSVMTFAAEIDDIQETSYLGGKADSYVPDEILVKFKNDSKAFRVVKVPSGQVKEKILEYAKNPNVEYAEPNYYAYSYATVNDTYYDYQWNFKDETSGGINVENAWDYSTGSGVIVAVLDTGIAYETYSEIYYLNPRKTKSIDYIQAPDLSGTIFVPGYDFINDDAHPNDDNGHGTHVAGTIAQTTNNTQGVAGIAYDASLMPVKVLDSSGSGSYSTIAEGIYYAADNGADVINMSLGGSVASETLENALAYAYSKGVTIVAAAGNDAGAVGYPAAYDEYVIAVGATRYDKTLAPYSNFGSEVDVVAPGGDMTVDQNNDGYGDGILQNTFGDSYGDFGYYFYQGTSMATPHVAAAAALLISHGNATTPDQVQRALQDTALDLGASGRDDYYGYGLIDCCEALQWVDTDTPSDPNTPPAAANDSYSTVENTPVAVTAAEGVLVNDSDQDGDSLSAVLVTGPTNGSLDFYSDGSFTYTPNSDFSGADSFTYKVSDGLAYSDEATVTINVNQANTPSGTVTYSVSYDLSIVTAAKNIFYTGSASVTAFMDNLPAEGALITGHWSCTPDISLTSTQVGGIASFTLEKTKLPAPPSFIVEAIKIGDVLYTEEDFSIIS